MRVRLPAKPRLDRVSNPGTEIDAVPHDFLARGVGLCFVDLHLRIAADRIEYLKHAIGGGAGDDPPEKRASRNAGTFAAPLKTLASYRTCKITAFVTLYPVEFPAPRSWITP